MVYHGLTIPIDDGNDVEAGFNIHIEAGDISIGGSNQHSLFPFGDGHIRLAVLVTLPSLHLHNDQFLTILGNDVDLLVDVTPIPLQNLVAFVGQILDSNVFAQLA